MSFDEMWESLKKEYPEIMGEAERCSEEVNAMRGCPPDMNPGFCDDPDASECYLCRLIYIRDRKPKLTNADKLRTMSDEELAIYHAEHCGCPPGEDPAFHGYSCNIDAIGCVNCWTKWLREEADDGTAIER